MTIREFLQGRRNAERAVFVFNWVAEPPPADPEAILSAFEKHYADLDDRIAGLSGWLAEQGPGTD
jgi:hypothetical protein